ncbi:MAG TPA: isoprenylcysteine carboxylmethyltransferase family protein [Anaerolineae bacterium]|nr:isoprenylcysteine carboxylmethyltransferase family protein [Anaerolineae bacterium]
MYILPLLFGFAFDSASAFTAAYSQWWGNKIGRLVSLVLRNILGIPLWVLGFALAIRTPSVPLFPATPLIDLLGWLLVIAGAAVILWALPVLGRRAAVPAMGDTLAAGGPYAYVRHPIYSGTLLEFAGLFLLHATRSTILACFLGISWLFIQAKLEEVDLLERIPSYREYMYRVPRFVPRLRRMRSC